MLDFDYFADKRYVRRVVLKDFNTHEVYPQLDYAELHFIEMSKFKKEYHELKTVLDRWVAFMNRAYQLDRQHLPPELAEAQEITQAVEKLERMYFNDKERERYEAERKLRMNQEEEIRTALEKGKTESRIEIATNLIKSGINLEVITATTGLTLSEVTVLMNQSAISGN